MTRFLLTLCFTSVLVFHSFSDDHVAESPTLKTLSEETQQTKSIFNGKNFDGWYLKLKSGDSEQAKKVFTITPEGWVHVFGDEFEDDHKLNTGKNDTHGMMYTENTYSKYILRFEYKWGQKRINNFKAFQYDAGVYYHVYDDNIWPGGVEYQVRYNHVTNKNHTGDFWMGGKCRLQWSSNNGEGAKHFLLPSEGGVEHPIKGGEHLANPNANFHALDNEWNQCEVIVMGDQYVVHKLNGEIVNIGRNLNIGEGKIGFQSETAEIFYRDIKVTELKHDLPLTLFTKDYSNE